MQVSLVLAQYGGREMTEKRYEVWTDVIEKHHFVVVATSIEDARNKAKKRGYYDDTLYACEKIIKQVKEEEE